MTVATAQRAAKPRQNGRAPVKTEASPEKLAEAMAWEETIFARAEEIRREATELTPRLLMDLWPLLREPFHEGFITHVSAGEGKPYESDGIRLQAQVDRMNNVLTPLWWDYDYRYEMEGRLCEVVVWVGDFERPLVHRKSQGGVSRGSTEGNLRKGSFTNAAKLAIARIGPGHEVYCGATDFDPDTDADAAKAQQQASAEEKDPNRPLSEAAVSKLRDELAKKQIPPQEVSMRLRGFGADALEALTAEQGVAFWAWLNDWKASANG